jgi:hypothetical protein
MNDMKVKGGLFERRPAIGGRAKGEDNKGVNMIKVRCMHVRKYHNETL